ncbi:DEAD/DEAH box helicase [Megalodesulfovibrio gigas]
MPEDVSSAHMHSPEGGQFPDSSAGVRDYVEKLKASPRLGPQVVCHKVFPEQDARTAPTVRPWPRAVQGVLDRAGVEALYSHQALATDLLRMGRHVVVATPTASGKTYTYNLPVLEACLTDPDARALYLFPLKALAQDQLKTFHSLTGHWPGDARPSAAIYDGDTSAHFRKKIRDDPPQVLLSNPEMLHLSLLPYHEKWAAFLASLKYVVVDEVHTYRGVMGSHMAQVFRRLRRVCSRFGADPAFCFCSATVANPVELATQLTGIAPAAVLESGAPQGRRHVLFLNPLEGASQAVIQLLQAALHRGLRTIVYSQSRKMTELLSLWVQQRAGRFKGRISAYRAGFLAEERRDIEARMASGELLAVISTSALELGIDIGGLDCCILAGYPGTVMQTLQRGGRVGRAQQESVVVLVAQEDALDQYFMRHPEAFFSRPPEAAVLNPYNPVILARHLECAATELPLADDESWLADAEVRQEVRRMEQAGTLLRSKDGSRLHSPRKNPHREIDLRGSGGTYTIELAEAGTVIGHVDEHRAFKETHQGAIYLHRGQSFVVTRLDVAARQIVVVPQKTDYFTRARGNKTTEILQVHGQAAVFGTRVFLGRLKVTETITGYEKRSVHGQKLLTIVPLELPPLLFETEGLWIEIPLTLQEDAEKHFLHFMGGIHALEHAAIGMLPLLVMTDRNDLGGISTPMHPQVGLPAVFIYDAAPGGVGLSRQAFAQAEALFTRTLEAMAGCPCETGCPSCVHSPKCGSGNRPIDKAAAVFLLQRLIQGPPPAESPGPSLPAASAVPEPNKESPMPTVASAPGRYGVLDVETRRAADEVGGWKHIAKMGVSVAVLYDSLDEQFHSYTQDDLPELFERLQALDLVIGYNLKRFDYTVLQPFASYSLQTLPTLDMLEAVQQRLGYRLKLDTLAQATLGTEKAADGLQALAWWKEDRLDLIEEYCIKDVAITRDLYLHGREHGYLLFTNKAGQVVRVPVRWA